MTPGEAGPPLTAELQGKLQEKGTRAPIAHAQIGVVAGGRTFTATSAEDGRFSLRLPTGEARVSVAAFGYYPFVQRETLVADKRLNVVYLVEKESYDPYEIVVVGKAERTEVSQTTLRGREIQQVPGTFGDPFRVITTLPGVAQMMSLLPCPIVRGSSPGSTGYLIDSVRVPLLFHFLGGPSVIHPRLIGQIDFMPGGFSVEHGGYTGGIVNGRTQRAGPEDKAAEIDLNLFQSGALVRYPIESLGITGTLAGRIGYPGLLLSLATPDVDLAYWDYQARIDGGSARSGWTVFAFGANDTLKVRPADAEPEDDVELETAAAFRFHRLDLRYVHDNDDVRGDYAVSLGYDESAFGPDTTVATWRATPRAKVALTMSDAVELRLGVDAQVARTKFEVPTDEGEAADNLTDNDAAPTDLYGIGVMTEALWRPTERLLVRPGVRSDVYDNGETTQVGIDPRVLARYRVAGDRTDATHLEGSVGLYHQPARFPIPVPGLDQLAFERGLLQAVQTSAGVETKLGAGFSVELTTYFNYMDPILFDLVTNPDPTSLQTQSPDNLPGELPDAPDPDEEGRVSVGGILEPQIGRSYGVELLVRRRSRRGAFGWLSYTLSRTERLRDDEWSAFDYDRTHILNLVAGIPLPRNWDLGMRVQVQSGRPLTTTSGRATARTDPFVRFDLRIDKRAVWNEWLLDFYIDISNVLLSSEEVAAGADFKYVLPTVGFRALL